MDLWLRNHQQHTTEPTKATHFYIPTKSYLNISTESQKDFWLNYCSSVKDGLNPSLCECMKNGETRQLSFNLNMIFERHQIPPKDEVITDLVQSIDVYAQNIIGTIQSMMNVYFEQTPQGSEFIACYLRRDDETVLKWKDNAVKYDGKIIFPYARVKKEYISMFYYYIRNQLQLHSITPDEYIAISPINGLDTLIQPSVNEMEELYGTSMDDDSPLKLHEIYGILNTDIKATFELSKIFVPTLHSAVNQGILTRELIINKIQEYGIDFWLPLFFSSGFYNISLKTNDEISLTELEAPTITMSVIRENESLPNIERARQLLLLVSIHRVEEYWSWIDIGNALHSIDSGDEGLKLWKWVSSQSDFKDEDDCSAQWDSLDSSDCVDISTLEYFAAQDNPARYKTLRDADVKEAINRAIHLQEHTPVAKAFKTCFPHEFICVNYEKAEWYHYNKHRWVSIDGMSILMWYVNEKFQSKIEQMRIDISQKIANSRDAEYKSRNENILTLIGTLIKKLSSDNFKKGLCSELRIYYHNPRFGELRDMNPHYTATPTGVIDLRGGVKQIRPGKPQDYITKSTRYGYPYDFTWETHSVKMTLEYIKQVFRSESLREYFWRFGASLLLSGNNDKIFPIFSGEGNNSKSILVRLFEAAFGGYSVKLPTSLITDKRTGADSATPSLIHARGAKMAFLQEPNKNAAIQSGIVKELTGHDSIYGRDLFQRGAKIVEMEVTFVPILVANKIPVIPDCQQAIWERTRVINYTSRWSSDAPDDKDEQFQQGLFKLDKFFDRQIPTMAPAFLWILVQKYEEYINEGLNDPPEVLEATENFRVNNNYYIHFTRDCIKQVFTPTGKIDNTAVITLDELFNAFRKWYGEQQFRTKMPTKTDFKEELQITWKQKADSENKWYGLQLNTQANTIQSLLSF